MAGHSHAANVAIRKGKQDRLKAKIFSRHSKQLMIAARGGADPDHNITLYHAIKAARADSMPKDKIDYAVKKGAGLLEGEKVEEVIYEGYAQGGVAILIECVTDNQNRTRPEVSSILGKAGGKMAATNSVMFMFERKGLFAVPTEKISEDKLLEIIIEAGADDLSKDGDVFEILTAMENFNDVQSALEAKNIEPTVAELRYICANEIQVDAEDARKVLNIIEKLEEHDDVNAVYSNMEFTDEVLKIMQEEG